MNPIRLISLALAATLAASAAATQKIALIGDSITQAAGYAVVGSTYPQNGNRSWRWEFFKHLVDAGEDFDFVGSISTNYANSTADDETTNSYYPSWRGVPFDRDHEGHWGWRAYQILGTSAGPSSGKRGTGDLSDWLLDYTPDSAVLMIGINDLNEAGQTPATLAANVSAIIDLLQADNPAIRIHLCELLHVGNHPNRAVLNAKVDSYNGSELPAIAATKTSATSTVSIVPMNNPLWDGSDWIAQPGGWAPSPMTYDSVHPNSRGEAYVAARVADSYGLQSQWSEVPVDNGNFEGGFADPGTTSCRPAGWTLFGSPNSAAVPRQLTDYSVVAESSVDTGTGTPGSSYIIAGPADTGISQTLSGGIEAGREYQLQLSLYKASTAAAPGDYAAELRADGMTLATISLTEELPMYLTGTGNQLGKCLKEFTASFRSDQFPAAIGQPLEIRLTAKNNARYIGFEDVRLSWRNTDDATLQVFVLTGQSNSLGTLGSTDTTMRQGAPGTHPADQPGGVPFYWDNRTDGTGTGDEALGSSGGWTFLAPQTGGVYAGNDDHWGPELGFARMLWNAGYRDFAIVKASRGGGGNTFWQKDSADSHMYQHLVATVTAATATLPEGYHSFRLASLLYLQGESNDASEAAAAGTRFSELLDNLRADLPDAGGMAGAIGEIAGSGTNRDTTRTAQAALASSRTDVGYASANGLLVHNEDGLNVHYDADSQILLGERLAAECIGMGILPEQPLPAWPDLHTWYIADNGSTFDSAGAVKRWANLQSGSATRDLTRKVAGQTFRRTVSSGSGQTRQAMHFDGSNDLWANASTEFGTLTGPRSVALVTRVTNEGDGFLFDGSTGSGRTRAQVRSGTWQAGTSPSGGAWNGAENDTAPRQTGVWQQHVFTFAPGESGTTVEHWIDGTLAASVIDPDSSSLGGLILGSCGGSPFTRLATDIAEIAVYATALGEAEITELKAGWDQRWGNITGPPFSATVHQSPREVARFGLHELLDLQIDCDQSGTTTLESLRIELSPGTAAKLARVCLVSESSGEILASIDAPDADELMLPAAAPLAEGTNHFQVAVEPRRHAPLGSTLDAQVLDLSFSGEPAGTLVPSNNDPTGALTLGLVPFFSDVRTSGEGGVN
ncbi:sialate O-acetylesterase, partial [Luteolibacter marinus]|uniref:sialate O-acetylesterase n=1 Tax=Luteolibacter marinus TaxID=2776705 RepID=UPI0018683DD0